MASNVTEAEMSLQSKMAAQREKLQEILETNFELLPKLVSSGALTLSENADIEEERTTSRKRKALLDVIFEKHKQQEFIAALRDSGQIHIVNWIEGNGVYRDEFGLDWPLTEKEEAILQRNFDHLSTAVDTDHGFLTALCSEFVISSTQMSFIQSRDTNFDRVKAFLDILRRSSLKKYFLTAKCLKQSNQDHIAKILIDGGVIVPVHSTQQGQNTEAAEVEIVQEMTRFLRERNVSLEDTDLSRLLARLRLVLTAVRLGDSIVLYICCYEMEEFSHLLSIVTKLEMKEILDLLFKLLLKNNQATVLYVEITKDDEENARKWFESEERRDKKFDEHFRTLRSQLPYEMEPMELTVPEEKHEMHHTMEVCLETEVEQSSASEPWKKCVEEFGERSSQANMTDEEIVAAIIRNNSDFFRECIKPANIIPKLSSLGILSDDSRRYIRSMRNKNEKNAEIVNVVRASSIENYYKFIRCLRETDQNVVANVAEKGGVAVKVKVVHIPGSNIAQMEQELVTRLTQLPHSDQASSKTEELWRFLSRLKMGGVEVLGARQDGGVLVWLWCRTCKAVARLAKLSTEEKLGDLFGALFRLLLPEFNLKINSICLDSTDVDFVSRRICSWSFQTSPTKVERIITGMAMLDDRVFIVCQDDNILLLFSCDEDGRCMKDEGKEKPLKDIKAPSHMAASAKTQCLYVTDASNNIVWKVGIGQQREMDDPKIWLGQSTHPICSLSVGRNDNVLVLRQEPSILEGYSVEAKQELMLRLPEQIVYPHHVAEAPSDGDFIISYGAGSNPGGICRITREGQWVFRFDLGSSPIKTLSPDENSVLLSMSEDLEFLKVLGNFTFDDDDDDDDELLYVCSEDQVVVLDSELSVENVAGKSGLQKPYKIQCSANLLSVVHGSGQNLLSVAIKMH